MILLLKRYISPTYFSISMQLLIQEMTESNICKAYPLEENR